MQTSAEIINEDINNQYQVVRLSQANLQDLVKLHSDVYNTAPSPSYFHKKYDTRYTGVEHVGYIAYNEAEVPVAFYGVLPCFIEWGDQKVLAAQSADTMTHPQHRYKGMFVDLSNKTFALCRELGIRLVFGFPNQNSYHGAVNKLGWKMTEAMDCFSIPIQSLPLSAISRRFKPFKMFYPGYTRFVLKKIILPEKGVANSALSDGFAVVCRSPEYLAYKTYSDTLVISADDARIWISIKNSIWIGDIIGVNETNFKKVIDRLKKMAKKLGIKQIQFHCSPGTSLHALFSAAYAATPSYPVLFQDFGSPIPPEKIKFSFADIDIF